MLLFPASETHILHSSCVSNHIKRSVIFLQELCLFFLEIHNRILIANPYSYRNGRNLIPYFVFHIFVIVVWQWTTFCVTLYKPHESNASQINIHSILSSISHSHALALTFCPPTHSSLDGPLMVLQPPTWKLSTVSFQDQPKIVYTSLQLGNDKPDSLLQCHEKCNLLDQSLSVQIWKQYLNNCLTIDPANY